MADNTPAAAPEAVDGAAFLSMRGISKSYGGVHALTDVDFACKLGSIHAVLGENGAGKSTLIKIISGVVQPDRGEMVLDRQARKFTNPLEANDAGVVCIFQELSLMPDLSVADNIGITDPPRNRLGLIDNKAQRRRAEELLAVSAAKTSIRASMWAIYRCRAVRWSKSRKPSGEIRGS